MSGNLGNKETMALNIERLMKEKGVNATEVCKTLGFPNATFSDWLHAKTYPRIDKIEKMALFFGVSKKDLVEEYVSAMDLRALAEQTVEEQRLLELWRKADGIDRQTIWNILSRYEEEEAVDRSSAG